MSNPDFIEAAPDTVTFLLEENPEALNEIVMRDADQVYFKVVKDPENPFKTPYFQTTDKVNPTMTIKYYRSNNFEIYYSALLVHWLGRPQWFMFKVTDIKQITDRMTDKRNVQVAIDIVKDIAKYKAAVMKERTKWKEEAIAVAVEKLEKNAKESEIKANEKTAIEEATEIKQQRKEHHATWKDVRDDIYKDRVPDEFNVRIAQQRAARIEALEAAKRNVTKEIDELLGGKRKSVRRGKLNHRRKSVRRGKLNHRRKSVRRRKLKSRR